MYHHYHHYETDEEKKYPYQRIVQFLRRKVTRKFELFIAVLYVILYLIRKAMQDDYIVIAEQRGFGKVVLFQPRRIKIINAVAVSIYGYREEA